MNFNIFSNVTWSNYFLTLLLLAVLYYSYILWKYYPSEVKNIFSKNGLHQIKAIIEEPDEIELIKELPDYDSFVETTDDTFELVEKMIAEIKDIFQISEENNFDKNHLLGAIKVVFQKYFVLINSPFRPAIDELILVEYQKYSSIKLSEEDVEECWNETT